MLLELTPDQEVFRETTARFLEQRAPVAELRRRRDDAVAYDPDYWRQAAELGWTSLLVDEGLGGGSITEHGLVDLALVAHEVGRRAAPGPLVPTNVVAGALAGDERHHHLLADLLDGSSIATWCLAEGPRSGLGDVDLEIRVDGGDVVLDGTKRPVEAAAEADHLLVTGRTGTGLTQVVVPVDAPGVTVTPLRGVDLTRRYATVDFAGVRVSGDAVVGQVGKADEDVERQLGHALVLVSAETVGALQTAFDMTVEWAFDRYSFGRPLASYQAIKHRFATMKVVLEASHAIADEAAAAVAAGTADAAKLASAAKAYTGANGADLMQDCVQLHGGIGVTFEHDLHLYLRRVTADRMTYGTPAEHRRRLAAHLAHEEEVG